MARIQIETSSFAVVALKLKLAKYWWDTLTEAQQKTLAKRHRIVTWEHVINAWERELGR